MLPLINKRVHIPSSGNVVTALNKRPSSLLSIITMESNFQYLRYQKYVISDILDLEGQMSFLEFPLDFFASKSL